MGHTAEARMADAAAQYEIAFTIWTDYGPIRFYYSI